MPAAELEGSVPAVSRESALRNEVEAGRSGGERRWQDQPRDYCSCLRWCHTWAARLRLASSALACVFFRPRGCDQDARTRRARSYFVYAGASAHQRIGRCALKMQTKSPRTAALVASTQWERCAARVVANTTVNQWPRPACMHLRASIFVVPTEAKGSHHP